MAHEPLISRTMVVEGPLTGLSVRARKRIAVAERDDAYGVGGAAKLLEHLLDARQSRCKAVHIVWTERLDRQRGRQLCLELPNREVRVLLKQLTHPPDHWARRAVAAAFALTAPAALKLFESSNVNVGPTFRPFTTVARSGETPITA